MRCEMTYPSFSSFPRTLRAILRQKASWLADESTQLAKALLIYSQAIGLEDINLRVLYLSAYFKNLGAVYLPEKLLSQRLNETETMTAIKSWQLQSAAIARQSGLGRVSCIMDAYYHRAIPDDQLASIFQVVNCWVACRQPKGYRAAMSIADSRIVLQQRAEMEWSDPALVQHFLATNPEES